MSVENWDAFDLGRVAAESSNINMLTQNPFPEKSDDWISWNKGWNTYVESVIEKERHG